MSARGRVSRAIGSSLLNVAALGGLACIVLVILAFACNITLIMFKTGSMSPTIPAGAVAVVREIPASDIRVGDVLTVNREGMLPVTHRVTSVSGEGDARTITMKGDANEAEDAAPYTVTEVRRVLFSVPELAKVVVWFSNPLVLGGITIAASVLVTWAFWPKAERGGRADGDRRTNGRHGAPEPATGRTGAVAVATLLLGSMLAVAQPAQAEAVSLAADRVVVTHGRYLTLTSIGDPDAMASMLPGVPVAWQVGVRVDAPDPGPVTLSLEASGSQSLGLSVEIRACSLQWIGTVCAGRETPVSVQGAVPVDSIPRLLASMRESEERWILISAMVPQHGRGTVELAVRAEGTSDAVVIGPGAVGMIARTGARPGPTMWLAGGAVAVGLLIAGAARVARRNDSGARS